MRSSPFVSAISSKALLYKVVYPRGTPYSVVHDGPQRKQQAAENWREMRMEATAEKLDSYDYVLEDPLNAKQ